ncbi:MAG: hypothetical protein ACRDQB_04520 [Thermocrispum sp.]
MPALLADTQVHCERKDAEQIDQPDGLFASRRIHWNTIRRTGSAYWRIISVIRPRVLVCLQVPPSGL